MNPNDVNVTGRKEAPDCPGSPLMSSDVMMTSDQWPRRLRSPGHHSPSENIPRSRRDCHRPRLAVDEEYFEILKWHNLWCGADTIICHVSEHRTSVGTRVLCEVCGHNECLQWSDPSPAPFIQILQTTDIHSITQQSQYNSLLRSSVCGQVDNALLCCVSHNAGSVLHPFVMTWSPPHLFPVSLSLSHLSSLLRAQPSRVIPSSSSVASRE